MTVYGEAFFHARKWNARDLANRLLDNNEKREIKLIAVVGFNWSNATRLMSIFSFN